MGWQTLEDEGERIAEDDQHGASVGRKSLAGAVFAAIALRVIHLYYPAQVLCPESGWAARIELLKE